MSYAPNYSPTVGFATEETNSVAGRSTVRTVAVDNELADISASINALNINIKLLQRDDGKPKDFIIEPYALSEQTRALVAVGGTPKGLWNAGVSYVVGDVVQYTSIAYLCTTTHISGGSLDPNLWLAISGDGSASTSATAAAASATSASSSATSASASATTATTKATESTVSAGSASTSATNASNSASAASTSATNASNSANSAAASATSASGSATAAATSESNAAAVLAGSVSKTTSTGSAVLPASTTANRDGTPLAGYIRFNTTLNQFEGYNGTAWGSIGGAGATGGGLDKVFVNNDTLVTTDYTLGQEAITTPVTATAATNLLNATAHGFIADQLVQFSTTTTLPAPLQTAYGYWVISSGLTANAFKVSLTRGGTEIDITDTGTGSHLVGKLKNASTAGVISIASGITVTIPTNSSWTIV